MKIWDDVQTCPCPTCNQKGTYCVDWDAACCLTCDEWLESNCCKNGDECPFYRCFERPSKPSEVL